MVKDLEAKAWEHLHAVEATGTECTHWYFHDGRHKVYKVYRGKAAG